jgi:hypothetical protein
MAYCGLALNFSLCKNVKLLRVLFADAELAVRESVAD